MLVGKKANSTSDNNAALTPKIFFVIIYINTIEPISAIIESGLPMR